MMTGSNSLTARDIMTRNLVTLKPDMRLMDAVRLLIRKKISGASVVDEHGRLLGVLSEYDCLRVLASSEYSGEDAEERARVEAVMTQVSKTIPPDMDLYSIAHAFLTHRIRRLPVVEGEKLVGQVSRRDVLRGIERTRARRIQEQSPSEQEPGLYLSATGRSPKSIPKRPK